MLHRGLRFHPTAGTSVDRLAKTGKQPQFDEPEVLILRYCHEMDQNAEPAADEPAGSAVSVAPPAEPQKQSDGFDAVRKAYPPLLNTSQVAELLDLNPRTVLNMAGDGRLPASRLPGSRKFHFLLEEIIDTLKANRVSPS